VNTSAHTSHSAPTSEVRVPLASLRTSGDGTLERSLRRSVSALTGRKESRTTFNSCI
jgi:FXSXX-COOH protein